MDENGNFWDRIYVELTNHCNLQCPECTYQRADSRKGYMDIFLYRRIIDEIAEKNPDCRVWLGIGGEPLLIRFQIYYMIRYAKNKGIRRVYIRTNGVLLTQELSEMLLDAGIDRVLITAGRVYAAADKETAYANAQYLLKRRKERNMETVLVEVLRDGLHKICQEADRTPELPGGGIFNLHNCGICGCGSHPQVYAADQECRCDRQVCASACKGRKTNKNACVAAWDGNVTAHMAGRNEKIVYGNLQESSLAEFWKKKASLNVF